MKRYIACNGTYDDTIYYIVKGVDENDALNKLRNHLIEIGHELDHSQIVGLFNEDADVVVIDAFYYGNNL